MKCSEIDEISNLKVRKVRWTLGPNLEPPEPYDCPQKPNLEPTEPPKMAEPRTRFVPSLA